MVSHHNEDPEIQDTSSTIPISRRRNPFSGHLSSDSRFAVFSVDSVDPNPTQDPNIVPTMENISAADNGPWNNSLEFAVPQTPTSYRLLDSKTDRENLQEMEMEMASTDLDDTFENTNSEPEYAPQIEVNPKPRFLPAAQRQIDETLETLRSARLSPFDLILAILDESTAKYGGYRIELYKQDNKKLGQMLDLIAASEAGRQKLQKWMAPHAVEVVCNQVYSEMDGVQKKERLSGIGEITPLFITTWKVSEHQKLAPILTKVLTAAAQTRLAKDKNKKKTPEAICNVIVHQLAYQRSSNSLGFQSQFGLFLWATGCARQTIDALHQCGLSVSYSSVLNAIESIADQCMKCAITFSEGIHVLGYDNINITTSIFVEQRGSFGPPKVTSGTFAVLYEVRNGNPEHMKLAPILARSKEAKPLSFTADIRPTVAQLHFVQTQLSIVIVRILLKYSNDFKSYDNYPELKPVSRRRMPAGYKTKQYPLRATTIEEATVRGNLLFHDDIYCDQLKRPVKDLCTYAIPTFNDQLTNSRIRSGQLLRARDINSWERREIFQLGFGLFHLCLNLVWALLHVHRGALDQTGSLTYFFAIMEKTRLGNEHPDYHTLLISLLQILDGLILNAWRMECGFPSISAFSKSKPTAEMLKKMAVQIMSKYATPLQKEHGHYDTELQESSGESSDTSTDGETREPNRNPLPKQDRRKKLPHAESDIAHENLRLLTRDLLYVAELIQAISDGDIGRVEDILPQLAMTFRGAGSNNYCTEILHFIHNLKYVWGAEFANIMRDNMLVNISGLEGHAMPIDLNIEHLIGELKILLAAKGLQSTWDQLGNISAAIDYLKKVKKQIASAMNAAYQGTTHTSPDTAHLVWRVADKVQKEKLQTFVSNRNGNNRAIPINDIVAVGEQKLKSSTLATFNQKIVSMAEGRLYEKTLEDIDTVPLLALGRPTNNEEYE